ncbi:MAG: tripartite tricarboxylate transporter substrate binding protein, partial [Comamonadaceae bacterium]
MRSALPVMCALGISAATAQSFPAQPIRIVVGFQAGGPSDVAARIAAEILTAKLGVPTVVDNRPGASGGIAAQAVANAKPDGYTLLVNVTADIINPVANREPDNLITRRFAPVALIAAAPNVLVVHPSVPVTSARELATFARSKEGLSYASAGQGTVSHLSGVLFANAVGAPMVHVPYKGTAAAQVDLLAGRVPVMFDSLISGLANAEAGKVKVLAVTSPARWPAAPNLPTLAESGLPETDVMAVFGLVAPAATPKPVINRISAVLLEGMQAAEVRKRIQQIGAEPGTLGPQAYGEYLEAQTARWQKLSAE